MDYQNILSEYLLPIYDNAEQDSIVFQQENASPHASKSTQAWMKSKNVTVFDWPCLSPDLNIMENIWGIMCHKIYSQATAYNSVEEYENVILKTWDEIDYETIQNLYDKCLQIIRCNRQFLNKY